MPSITTIRRSLLSNLVPLIVLLGVAVLGTTFLGSRRMVERLSGQIISRTLAHMEASLETFFEPAQRMLRITADWAENGEVASDRPGDVQRLLEPLMRQVPQVSAVLVADERGRETMLMHLAERWRRREVRQDEWGRRASWAEWTRSDPMPRERKEELDYDPRTRPWFRGASACQPGQLHWTEPYLFFTAQEPGITGAAPVRFPDGVRGVVGCDVLLAEISAFSASLQVSQRGMAMILTGDQLQVVGLPRSEALQAPEARREALLRPPEELGLPAVKAAGALLRQGGGPPAAPRRLRVDGEAWWIMARPFALGTQAQLLLVVLVPETDVLADVATTRLWILGLTGVFLVLGVLRAVMLARRYIRPIEQLSRHSDRISQGQLVRPLEEEHFTIMELQHLARAQERMRQSLLALMRMEEDMRLAQQIQRNTFPSSLPELPGFEVDAWSEPADATGGDTYDVIGVRPGEDQVLLLSAASADRAVLLLADATGHGVGPALSVAEVRAMLRMAVRMGARLETIASHMNEQLCEDLQDGRFISAWLGDLDAATGALTCFSAGQGPVIWYRASADTCELRMGDTHPLGILPALEPELPDPLVLERGDVLLVASDGIHEAEDRRGRRFGIDRIEEVLRAHRQESASQILHALRDAVIEFAAGAPASDDRTMLVIKRTGR